MAAKVKVDAFPGRVFDGKLARIGILPDAQSAQMNPGLKLYKCEVECNFKDVIVRPGMSSAVELIKDVYENELYLPVQCVVRVNDQTRVYVQSGDSWEPRDIEVGLDNNTMIRVLGGVAEGEVVMLAPPVQQEKDAEVKPEALEDHSGSPAKSESSEKQK
jgi:HlyD family secretion protein